MRVALLVAAVVVMVPVAVAADAWDQTYTMDAAEVGVPAVRDPLPLQVTDTEPPPPRPSIRDTVNALHYRHYQSGPALIAFRLVAAERGWSSSKILAWEPFVNDVMFGESAYCWNRRRGDVVAEYSACVITRQGRYEDVGFGQVTRSYYGRDGLLCTEHEVCSSEQILASPYDSMKWSIVVLLELSGSQPWCWNSYARGYHKCTLAPDR